MGNIKSAIITVGLIAVLGGCSSPKDASKSNFKAVINAYLDNHCIMVSPRKSQYPMTVELLPPDGEWAVDKNSEKTEQYDALVSIDMLEVEEGSAKVSKNRWLSSEKITVPTKIYSLSEEGKKFFKKNTTTGFFGSSTEGFCAGTLQVTEIGNFSEPSQAMMGYTVSNVSYTVSPKNVEGWAVNENIVKFFPRLAGELAEEQEESVTLVLMNDGWVHEREVKR